MALVLDHRPTIGEHDVAALPLGQLVGDLVVDELVMIGIRALPLRRRQLDRLDRDARIEAQAGIGHAGIAALLALATGVADLLDGRRRTGRCSITQQRARVELIGVFDQPFLGLATKQLALEPVQLLLQRIALLAQLGVVRASTGW